MRERWREATLGALCTITKGSSPTQKTLPGPYPLIVTGPEHLSSDAFQFDGEAVCVPLVSSTGHGHASLKRVHYASGKFAVANIIAACMPRPEAGLDAMFLYHYLQHHKDAELVTRMKGTANVSLSMTNLADVPIRVPPRDEQRRIVDLIAAVDDAVVAAEAEVDALEVAVQGYRRVAMSSVTEMCMIADVARIVTGRTFKAEHQGRKTGILPYFRVSDMNLPGNERELLSPSDWLDEAGVAAVKPVICPPGTVVFPILGAALATEKRRVLGIEAGFVQHMIGLVPGPLVSTGWLLAVMSEVRLADISQKGALPSVNQALVGSIEMPLPDIDEQARIVRGILALTDAADAARDTADALRTLRMNLLTVLLSGEHEIPASYDVLLDEATI